MGRGECSRERAGDLHVRYALGFYFSLPGVVHLPDPLELPPDDLRESERVQPGAEMEELFDLLAARR